MITLEQPKYLDPRLTERLEPERVQAQWRDSQEIHEKMKFIREQLRFQASLARQAFIPLCEIAGYRLTVESSLEEIESLADLCIAKVADLREMKIGKKARSQVNSIIFALEGFYKHKYKAEEACERIVSLTDSAYDRLTDLDRIERETIRKVEQIADRALELSDWIIGLCGDLGCRPQQAYSPSEGTAQRGDQ